MMRKLILALCLAVMGACLSARADSIPERPLLFSVALSVGHERAFNTYLSPIRHGGTAWQLAADWRKDTRSRFHLQHAFTAAVSFASMYDHSGASAMANPMLDLHYRLYRHFALSRRLTLSAGAGMQVDAGMLYLPRNSNNPVAANLSAFATINTAGRYRLSRRVAIAAEASMPLAGIFFSPHYGQSYYEIYLGDRNGLVRAGWPGNHFGMSAFAGAEIKVGKSSLLAGYQLQLASSYASQINTRRTLHSLTLALRTAWLSAPAYR